MSKRPVLVLQFRRLGDIILTFPLLDELKKIYPGHPLLIGAQDGFCEPLKNFYSDGGVIGPKELPRLISAKFEAVINLGGDDFSAEFTGRSSAEIKLGKIKNNGSTFIEGFWHLYRESLTLNNWHNIFHWGDLFRMDVAPITAYRAIPPRPAGHKRVGFFVGASEPLKRPDPEFWVTIARKCAANGYKPILLGGPSEMETGEKIIAMHAPAVNFCGKTSLPQLAGILESLDLLVTPDTGPMHLANFLSVPVLNLSMGNVNAAETGPYDSDQHILRSHMSCAGCWECGRRLPVCRKTFIPKVTADFILDKLAGKIPVSRFGLDYLGTDRDKNGYHVITGERATTRTALDKFWKDAFLEFGPVKIAGDLNKAGKYLIDTAPRAVRSLNNSVEKLFLELNRHRKKSMPLDSSFWQKFPRHLRIFAGFIHMALQNENYSSKSFAKALTQIETVRQALQPT